MRSPLVAPDGLLGAHEPRIRFVPPAVSSAGRDAIDCYALAGRQLDAWQQQVLHDALGERPDGRWAAFEVGLNVARQNGKDEILAARELAGLFVWGERLLIHSAHKFDTAMEHLERLVTLIDNVPEFSKRVKKINRSHGQEGITLRDGARIRFRARTRSGGARGYTGDCVIFNEAMDLPDEIVGSIMPTMSARSMMVPGPQIWIAGSAVDQETMANGLVFTRVRNAGIEGGNDRLAYLEWSADVQGWLEARGLRFDPRRPEIEQVTPEMLADPAMWAQANPALGMRISLEHIRTEFRSPSMSGRQFAVERLGIGDPPDVSDESGRVISLEAWQACACTDESKRIEGVKVFAVKVNPDRTWGSIAVSGRRDDGMLHVALVDHRRGTGWLVDRCVELHDDHPDALFVMDSRGPESTLIQPLKDAGVEVLETSTRDYAIACGGFFDAVAQVRVKYPVPQPELDEALASARTRTLGDAWAWAPRTSTSADISPLEAATLAVWGAETQEPAGLEPLIAWR